MQKLKLNNGVETLIDEDDYDFLSRWDWFFTGRYVVRAEKGVFVFIHKVINKTPKGFVTDHINGNPLDNRKINLRTCTQLQNRMNSKKPINGITSKYKGVRKRKDVKSHNKAWTAAIKKGLNRYHLGSFYTEIEAAKAYDKKAKELFGEYAHLNFS